jgi:hypothetical protein
MTNAIDSHYLATVSNPRQIHDHPVNNSATKALYSFPKADRFPDKTFKSPCNVVFYDYNSNLFRDNRAYSMGGIRNSDMMVTNRDVPAPNTYEVKYFNISAQTKRGFSFGKPDQKNSDRGLTEKRHVPGPGAYDINRDPRGKPFTFRIKTKRIIDENVEIGPGQYNIPNTLDPKHKHLLSNYKSVPNVKLVPPKQNQSKIPLPAVNIGYYDTSKCQINQEGKYYLSRFKNSRCRTFSKSQRKFIEMANENPGPGHYRAPSEFGLYESSAVKKKE